MARISLPCLSHGPAAEPGQIQVADRGFAAERCLADPRRAGLYSTISSASESGKVRDPGAATPPASSRAFQPLRLRATHAWRQQRIDGIQVERHARNGPAPPIR